MNHDVAMLGNSGYERRENDFYSTPAWVTEVLCDAVELPLSISEPAAGEGAIADVLYERGHLVIRTDIRDGNIDFLKTHTGYHYSIVTNPPYALAEEFIRHALKLTEAGASIVAMLLRNEYDCAKSRTDLFEHPAFKMKIVLTKRPRWIEGSTGSPRHNFAWYVWDWKNSGPPTIIWRQ